MKRWYNYIKLFWYFASNWNPVLACFILYHEIQGEKKYGLNTSNPAELKDLTIVKGDIQHSSRYEAVNYFILEALLARLITLTASRRFTDLGCGKGRAMVVAAHYGFTNITGVDFASEVCDNARKNMQKATEAFSVEYQVLCCNVLDYTINENDCVFFMFNPFSQQTLFAFLEKLETSIKEHPRVVYFLYASPRHIETFFEFEYEPVYRKRKLKWLDGVILKKDPSNTSEET
ncbi:MAG: methyltransferase domain-containing protein [Chitinophagaceae bacterium]|nr:methyltransferase domain-containing protein [Chitinophagaceae bacterium]